MKEVAFRYLTSEVTVLSSIWDGRGFSLVLIGELIEVVVETIEADKASAFDLAALSDRSGLDGLAVDQLVELGSANPEGFNR
jgi:hypothetical protein